MSTALPRLVYVDSGVLIAAARGVPAVSAPALAFLANPGLHFASSAFVRLEVLPKARYNHRTDEAAFYEVFFDGVSVWAPVNDDLLVSALAAAETSGLSAVDALHVAAAIATGADELVTTEQASKPIHRTTLIRVLTIAE
jgi:predicted nucleic acid-binding protein